MMQNDLGMVRHWIHPLKSGCRIEPRTANVALESTGAEDLLQFVQPRQLQGQRMLGVLSCVRKAIEDFVHFGQGAAKPPGDRSHAFAADYEPGQYSCRQGSRSFGNHTTKARSPLEVLIDAAQVIDQLAFLGVCGFRST